MNTVCSIFVGWIVLVMAFGNLNVVVFFFCLFVLFVFQYVLKVSGNPAKNNDESEKPLRLKRSLKNQFVSFF